MEVVSVPIKLNFLFTSSSTYVDHTAGSIGPKTKMISYFAAIVSICTYVSAIPVSRLSHTESPIDVLPLFDVKGRQPNIVVMPDPLNRQPVDVTSQNHDNKERQLRGVEVHCQSEECAELIKYINARDPHTVIMFPGRWGK